MAARLLRGACQGAVLKMIHEFALEPELVASWRDRLLGRFFIEQFGFGGGRVGSRYPKQWRRLVWDAFQAAVGAAGDIEQKRVEELLARLTTRDVRRPECVWHDAHDWLMNAENEHARKPFFGILARENPRTKEVVICADDVLSGMPVPWRAPSSVVVSRTAESMARAGPA